MIQEGAGDGRIILRQSQEQYSIPLAMQQLADLKCRIVAEAPKPPNPHVDFMAMMNCVHGSGYLYWIAA